MMLAVRQVPPRTQWAGDTAVQDIASMPSALIRQCSQAVVNRLFQPQIARTVCTLHSIALDLKTNPSKPSNQTLRCARRQCKLPKAPAKQSVDK